jgi:hypothetical protein
MDSAAIGPLRAKIAKKKTTGPRMNFLNRDSMFRPQYIFAWIFLPGLLSWRLSLSITVANDSKPIFAA